MKKSNQELSQADKNRIQQSKGRGTSGDFSALLRKLDEDEAADAGMPLDQWLALPEVERIQRWEHVEDRKFAGKTPLELYRLRKRAAFEAGELRNGAPMWLRSEYAQEDPQKIANDLARLVFYGAGATGEILAQTIVAMECRTHRGWLGTGLGFAELRARVEEEVDRLGLREQFNEELAQFAERNVQ